MSEEDVHHHVEAEDLEDATKSGVRRRDVVVAGGIGALVLAAGAGISRALGFEGGHGHTAEDFEHIKQRVDPSLYQELENFVGPDEAATLRKHVEINGIGVLDFLGCAVFAHGVGEIVKNGHVGTAPYTELFGLWVAKFTFGDEKIREHLLHEIALNTGLVSAILGLVTLGENTGFDVEAFNEGLSKKLDKGKARETQNNIFERARLASDTLGKIFLNILSTVGPSSEETRAGRRKSLKEILQGWKRTLKSKKIDEEMHEVALLAVWFIEMELMPAVDMAYRQEGDGMDRAQFERQWVEEHGQHVILGPVLERFSTQAKVDEVYKTGAGLMLFASATSPVSTTVSTSVISGNSGMSEKVSGPEREGFEDDDFKWSDVPPFNIRARAILEDHVSNLSGLGGFGDPPFLAMLLKFGWKGLLMQTLVSFPSTLLSAQMSYAELLQEHFPFLSKKEALAIASEQLIKLSPDYLKALLSNIANVFGALIEAAVYMGSAAMEKIFASIGIKDWLEKKTGKPMSQWRFRSGMQFSIIDMINEVIDEFSINPDPSPENLRKHFSQLAEKIEECFDLHLEEVPENEDELDAANQDRFVDQLYFFLGLTEDTDPESDANGHPDTQERIDNEHGHFLLATVGKLRDELDALMKINTQPPPILKYEERIARLQKLRAAATDPKDKHTWSERIQRLMQAKRAEAKVDVRKEQREQNVEAFVEQRNVVNTRIALLEARAKLIKDKETKRQVLYVVMESKRHVALLELTQLGYTEGLKGANKFERIKAMADMEHLNAVLGHRRAEVVNVLTFQASCVPFLTPVFKEILYGLKGFLNKLPAGEALAYRLALFMLLNSFSSGADNLVAALVGLEIEPKLWPYVMQASIDGGKNSRIANMANLAGCSMEEFALKISVCKHLLKKRAKRAAVNFGYAAILEAFDKLLGGTDWMTNGVDLDEADAHSAVLDDYINENGVEFPRENARSQMSRRGLIAGIFGDEQGQSSVKIPLAFDDVVKQQQGLWQQRLDKMQAMAA